MRATERQDALEHARQGDVQALGQLLDSYRPYIRVMVRALRSNRLQAQVDDSDLVQDALLEAHRSFASFRGVTMAEWITWLRRVVFRSTGRTLRSFLAADKRDVSREQQVEDLANLPANGDSSPSAQAIRHEQAARMAEALAALPEDMQQVVLARQVDGLPHGAIAAQMNRTEAAVRVLYVRALRRLRELYRE